MKKLLGVVGVVLGLAVFLVILKFYHAKEDNLETTTLYAMDTLMEIQVAGDEALLDESERRIGNLEKALSVTDPESEIGLLNEKKQYTMSKQTTEILKNALDICKETDGDLDISIYPVLTAWGFTTSRYRIPEETEIKDLLKYVDYRRISIRNGSNGTSLVTIPSDMKIDLGSIVKGYTSNMLADYYRKMGVKSALINLGGNVQCVGKKPNGQPWNVAIKSPFKDTKSGILGVIKAEDVAIITSGGYERFFESNGEVFWHILDPDTGKPAKNGLVSVTIIGKDGLMCDGFSTALFVKGLDEAIDFWKTRDDFDAVFITDDGNVYVTEGIADKFSLSSEYYDAKLTVVRK